MTGNSKIRYQIDLSSPRQRRHDPVATIRRLEPTDKNELAGLMLNAYVDTIDYEGESLSEALDAVNDWLDDSPMIAHSYGALVEEQLVSAVLMMTVDNTPFIAFIMTDPNHKRTGLGRAVVQYAIGSLRDSRHQCVVLYITEGNTGSERLFEAEGALPTPRQNTVTGSGKPGC